MGPHENLLLISDNSPPSFTEMHMTCILGRSKMTAFFTGAIEIIDATHCQHRRNWAALCTAESLAHNVTEKCGIDFALWQKPSVWPIRVWMMCIAIVTPIESRVKSSICHFIRTLQSQLLTMMQPRNSQLLHNDSDVDKSQIQWRYVSTTYESLVTTRLAPLDRSLDQQQVNWLHLIYFYCLGPETVMRSWPRPTTVTVYFIWHDLI